MKQGYVKWNAWRKKNPTVKVDLFRADLTGLNLMGADLERADISGAYLCQTRLNETNLRYADLSVSDLTGADTRAVVLQGANLQGAILRDADFTDADVMGVDFRNADLRGVNFQKRDLINAVFSGSRLAKANFSKARIGQTVFAAADISEVLHLDKVDHVGPSTLGEDTIAQSKGKIPETFLRGCGLSDLEIEFAKLANPGLDPEQVTDITYKIHQLYLGGGIQYYSCFISYNSRDDGFAEQLYNDLQNNGVRCWFAPEDMKIGDRIRITIDQQIRRRDKLLVILSDNSLRSEWVGDEVEAALEEEIESKRTLLFPIRLDDTVMNTRDDWAAKIKRRRHIGDFSNWKDKASYQKAFERLLRDLKATGGDVGD